MSCTICVMGCEQVPGQTFHVFPKDPKRRAEWCRILGVYPKTKRVFLCNAHFSDYYFFGNRITRYALPNPPGSQTLSNLMRAIKTGRAYQKQKKHSLLARGEISENAMPALFDDDSVTTFPETEKCYAENKMKADNLAEDPLQDDINIQLYSDYDTQNKMESSNLLHETGESQKEFKTVEDFEIRKGNNKDVIIKGRYVQTKDYLVVSYTPPRKWSLQEQVEILDKTSKQQLQTIRQLEKENYRITMDLKKHEKLLPKLRFLQTHNRYICAQLKMYKIHEKNLRDRIKKKKLKNNKCVGL